mgnify:CR=1 FL=1
MRALKRAISLFLAGITALTMMCVGTINAGAVQSSNFYVIGSHYNSYYTVYLGGISEKDLSTAISTAKNKNVMWSVTLDIVTPNKDIYTFMAASSDDNLSSGVLSAYYFVMKNYKSDSSMMISGSMMRVSSTEWGATFSISKDLYKVFNEPPTYASASVNVNLTTDPDGSDLTWQGIGSFKWTGLADSSSSNSTSNTKKISDLSVSSISNQTYSGKAKTPDVKIKDGSYTLKKGTDYTLSYKDNKKIGKATVTITGKGKYSGTKTVTFKIIPKKTTLTVKKTDEKYTFSWGKVSGVDKYQIYYSTDGKNYTKLANISSKKTSYSTTKLDESKTYSFKIRSYKKVDGKTYYSKFSKVVKK